MTEHGQSPKQVCDSGAGDQDQRSTRAISRRNFLTASAAGLVPLILPSGVLALGGRPGANNRIVTGHIGIGARGFSLLSAKGIQPAALCDVDAQHLHQAGRILPANVRVYRDHRELIERQDLDAVIIATPHHWHGHQAIQACAAGRDLYIEPPAFYYLAEAQLLAQAASAFGIVFAIGHDALLPGASNAGLPSGTTRIVCWAPENPVGGVPHAMQAPPENLDWAAWLGPAPRYPYNPDYAHGNFQWMLDFGGGRLCREGALLLAHALRICNATGLGKVEVRATGSVPRSGLWDCPTTLEIEFNCSALPIPLLWRQPGGHGDGPPAGLTFESAPSADGYQLENGHLSSSHGTVQEPGAVAHPALAEWLTRIRSRENAAGLLDTVLLAAELCQLGNLAYRLNRPLVWDSVSKQFEDDSIANRLRTASRFPEAIT